MRSIFFIFFVYFLDQTSKFYIRKLLVQNDTIPIVKDIFHFTYVHNTGAAFGLFKQHPYVFIVIAVLAVVFIAYFLIKKGDVLNSQEKAALCLILAGTIGNLTDRILWGYVIDFIDFRVWPVFNVADSCITVGVVLLGWRVFRQDKRLG